MKKVIVVLLVIAFIAGGYFYYYQSHNKSFSTPSNVESKVVALRSTGLGDVNFGSSPQDVISKLITLLGSPSKDTGSIDSFSAYGTCPGESIRVVEWSNLTVFFGNTSFGTNAFFHWQYFVDEKEKDTQGLTTDKGLGLGMNKETVRSLYPGAVIEPWLEEYEIASFGPRDYQTNTFFGGTLKDKKVFSLSGGISCGE